jgi:valyl-tRNA synthetase
MDFGTGIMKCTPAHDNMDYEIAQRHNIKEYNTCINFEGKLNEFAKVDGLDLQGVDRIVAREKIIDFLKAKNLLEKTDENYTNNVGYSERTGEVIEPLPSLQ